MWPKTKVQLKAEIEQAKRELQEYHAGTDKQIRVLQNAEAGLSTELEELRELIWGFEQERRECQAKIKELQIALGRSRSRSCSRSPLQSGTHKGEDALKVSPTVREVMLAKDEALQAIDHSHWELDKMKRKIQQSLQEVAESLKAEITAKLKEQFVESRASNPKGEGSTLGGGSCELTSSSDMVSLPGQSHREEASSVVRMIINYDL